MSLSCFDEKRFILGDGIHTLAYIHKDLRKQIHANDHKQEKILIDEEKFKNIVNKRRDSHR